MALESWISNKVQITQSDYNSLQHKLKTLWAKSSQDQKDIAEVFQEDGVRGIWSSLNLNAIQCQSITNQLKEATVVSDPVSTDVVSNGLMVVLSIGNNKEQTYKISGISGIGQNILSTQSPLWKALLGHSKWDVVPYEVHGNNFSATVLDILLDN